MGRRRHGHRLMVVLHLVVVLIGAACSGSSVDDETTSTTLDDDAVHAQVRALADEARAEGFDRQAGLLDDGTVTEAEYRQATMWAVECMEREGLDVSEVREVETLTSMRTTWIAGPGASGLAEGDVSRITDECQREFDLSVIQAWDVQDRGRIKEHLREPFADCLRRGGLELDAPPSSLHEIYLEVEDAEDRSTIGACRAEIEASLDPGAE